MKCRGDRTRWRRRRGRSSGRDGDSDGAGDGFIGRADLDLTLGRAGDETGLGDRCHRRVTRGPREGSALDHSAGPILRRRGQLHRLGNGDRGGRRGYGDGCDRLGVLDGSTTIASTGRGQGRNDENGREGKPYSGAWGTTAPFRAI